MILDPEDEAFNEIERQAKQRKEAVKASVSLFGQDTINSFAIYIRSMK